MNIAKNNFLPLAFFVWVSQKIPQEIKKGFIPKDFKIVSGEFSSFWFIQIRAETYNA